MRPLNAQRLTNSEALVTKRRRDRADVVCIGPHEAISLIEREIPDTLVVDTFASGKPTWIESFLAG